MKLRNLTTLGIILVAIIGIIIIANQLQNKKPSEQSLVFLPQFSEAACSQMLVVEGKDSAKLVKHGSAWFVTSKKAAVGATATVSSPVQPTAAEAAPASNDEYQADSAAIQTALDKLKNLKRDDLISQNVQKQAELEVDTAKGIYVEVWNDKGKSTGAFYIGKSGANWDSHFIREKGSNDVYLASGSVRFSFFGDSKRWNDKSVVRFDKSFVKSLQITRKDSGSIELVKTVPVPTDTSIKEGWQIVQPEKFKAKKDKAEQIINTLSTLNAADFESDTAISADSMGFAKQNLIVTATLQSGETKTVIVGNKKGTTSQYWAKNPENTKAIFLIAEYNINNLNQGLSALKDVPEAALAKDATKPGVKAAPVAPKKEKVKKK